VYTANWTQWFRYVMFHRLAINFAILCTAFINLATTWKGNLANQLAAIIRAAAGHPYIWSLLICHAIWPTNVG
jgi:hypothetical protein